MIKRERVIEILEDTSALKKGHFLLTSGRHSDQYMQCAQVLQYPEYTGEICKGLAKEFKDDKIDIVVGPATGGIIMAYEIARQLETPTMFTERENGKMVLRRDFAIPKGAKVLVAEDVITTGGSVKEVIELVKEAGGELVGVAVLVDRSNGKIDFGTKLRAGLNLEVLSYGAEECPICKEGNIPLVKPGSRGIKKD
ncbi:orotate phosphoribosyltransferase [Alkaliphilus sp. MSJ-5]|uniref:Orotate phosphoribosyltransferase n=1 Tax=Alkaliphilus flagellatus TaxID=2841507 RepID=A0ABS6G0K7_9FIRM|nr:orotate phosphoribosyltransferase [Alkaliphilus flagellatus]MBU5674881.1 orotate phosphoribosyltransferase [Alkaliphilus flagellatus]